MMTVKETLFIQDLLCVVIAMNCNVFFLIYFFNVVIGELPYPRITSVSLLDQCHHLPTGWSSQFSNPGVRPLQIHPEEMLQAEGLQ